jgi:hypothetical protein
LEDVSVAVEAEGGAAEVVVEEDVLGVEAVVDALEAAVQAEDGSA